MLNTESVLHVLEPLFHLATSSLPLTLIFKYSIHPHRQWPLLCFPELFLLRLSPMLFLYALVRPLTQPPESGKTASGDGSISLLKWTSLMYDISDWQPCDGVKVEKRKLKGACECHGCMFSDHACGMWVLM